MLKRIVSMLIAISLILTMAAFAEDIEGVFVEEVLEEEYFEDIEPEVIVEEVPEQPIAEQDSTPFESAEVPGTEQADEQVDDVPEVTDIPSADDIPEASASNMDMLIAETGLTAEEILARLNMTAEQIDAMPYDKALYALSSLEESLEERSWEEEGLYLVSWKNYDGSILYTEEYEYGELPQYKGPKPMYPGTVPAGWIYVFGAMTDGRVETDSRKFWNPEVSIVTTDTEYKAKYIKYDSSKYAVVNVHYLVYDGETSKEIENRFTYVVKAIGTEVKVSEFAAELIQGYTFAKASCDSIRVEKNSSNDIYLYYISDEDSYKGKATINIAAKDNPSSEADSSASGTNNEVQPGYTLKCHYEPDVGVECGDLTYTWYVYGVDKSIGNGETLELTPDLAGKTVYCEVKDTGASKGAVSNAVKVRYGSGTATIIQKDTTKPVFDVVYTSPTGASSANLKYKWYYKDNYGNPIIIGTAANLILTNTTNYGPEREAFRYKIINTKGSELYCEITDGEGKAENTYTATTVYSIQTAKTTGGTISPAGATVSGSTYNYVLKGSTIKFTFVPTNATLYKVASLKVDNTAVSLAANYTFKDIKSCHTLYVGFGRKSTETVNAPGVKVSGSSATLMVGKSTVLQVPLGVPSDYVWSSNASKVATVWSNGKVTAVKPGTARITARLSNGLSKTWTITVKAKPTKVKASIKKKQLKIGKSFKLKAKLTPKNAYPVVTFTSTNPYVASVNGSGRVKALKKGKATIIIKTANGKKAACKITVK